MVLMTALATVDVGDVIVPGDKYSIGAMSFLASHSPGRLSCRSHISILVIKRKLYTITYLIRYFLDLVKQSVL